MVFSEIAAATMIAVCGVKRSYRIVLRGERFVRRQIRRPSSIIDGYDRFPRSFIRTIFRAGQTIAFKWEGRAKNAAQTAREARIRANRARAAVTERASEVRARAEESATAVRTSAQRTRERVITARNHVREARDHLAAATDAARAAAAAATGRTQPSAKDAAGQAEHAASTPKPAAPRGLADAIGNPDTPAKQSAGNQPASKARQQSRSIYTRFTR